MIRPLEVLPSHYLPTEHKDKYIKTKDIIKLFQQVKKDGTSAMNVALALDLIEREALTWDEYKEINNGK
jgi:hypothetical protein